MIRPAAEVEVAPGPALLAGIDDGPGWQAHVGRLGPLPLPDLGTVLGLARDAAVRGRGGAAFPLATKIATAASGRRRPVVVVNAAEGEPASAKDSALLGRAPHRVLDGALVAARALGAREVHVVTSAERPATGAAVETALAERARTGAPLRWRHHRAEARFVSGQARAVLELLAGREGAPVTAWQPEAVRGHRGRPTLLSNAETFAQLGHLVRAGAAGYAALGTPQEPGTTLLTLARAVRPGHADPAARVDVPARLAPPRVVEVAHGTPFAEVDGLAGLDGPVLFGGFHGTWAPPGALRRLRVSRPGLAAESLALGAGVVLPLAPGQCPVAVTAWVAGYLAAESAGRCGPCRLGLPALAGAVVELAAGHDTRGRIIELTGVVTGRGACAHPDGTARLARTLLAHLPDEVAEHLDGACGCGTDPAPTVRSVPPPPVVAEGAGTAALDRASRVAAAGGRA